MRVLVVDDERSMREYLELLLGRAGYQVHTAASSAEAVEWLSSAEVDLVVSDMKLGHGSGLEVLRAARSLAAPPEVILITAFSTPESAVEAMRQGAYDYIRKPFDNDEMLLLVQKALEKRQLLLENSELRSTLSEGAERVLLGRSVQMQRVLSLIQKVASSRSTVLIYGESGTGKELVARALHWKGSRAAQPFLPLNCAALPEGLLESELFGHMKGAFTGATTDRPGILAAAREGTVFLDEIGEMSLATQVKLLRALQERSVRPVGSMKEVSFHARVIAATNRRLESEVREGRFREDLFYRLNVITIEVPPLRERASDIPLLAEHFLRRMKEETGRPNLRFSQEALTLLERFSFPGNVRQLQNIVERAATLADSDVLGGDMLPSPLRGDRSADVPGSEQPTIVEGFSLERLLDETERRYLVSALEKAQGNKTRAADILGITFRSLRYRLAKHGLSERDEVL